MTNDEKDIFEEYRKTYGLHEVGMSSAMHDWPGLIKQMKLVILGKRSPIKPGEFEPKVGVAINI